MRKKLLDILACPICKGDLKLEVFEEEGDGDGGQDFVMHRAAAEDDRLSLLQVDGTAVKGDLQCGKVVMGDLLLQQLPDLFRGEQSPADLPHGDEEFADVLMQHQVEYLAGRMTGSNKPAEEGAYAGTREGPDTVAMLDKILQHAQMHSPPRPSSAETYCQVFVLCCHGRRFDFTCKIEIFLQVMTAQWTNRLTIRAGCAAGILPRE